MAELVLQNQCRSPIRKAIDGGLNATFPLWGVGIPIGALCMTISAVTSSQMGKVGEAMSILALMSLLIFISITCVITKRFLSHDMMIVDRSGIVLPKLLGRTINWSSYIAWKDVSSINAIVPGNDLSSCKLAIHKKRGGTVMIPTSSVDPTFVEQILLAANMWAPDVCDASLQSLTNLLRIGDAQQEQSSHTALWEEELGRRFCPSAYIALEPGRTLRNCSLKIINHLASGGLSSLYLCQLDGSKLVVLKEAVVPEDTADSVREKAAELFQRESALLMKLEHANVVRVLDSFVEQGRNYMMMEYVNGSDLRQLVLQNGPQSESYVLEWAISIANTLKYLHEREKPIIHRDLTPDNIVLRNDGQVIIVDFGAANEFIGNATGTFVGKHSFIAPEQFRGKASVQSDIYAFGCTLHYLLTGVEPEALCPSDPRSINSAISEELGAFVLACTQLEASDRYHSAAQLVPILKGIAAQSVVL